MIRLFVSDIDGCLSAPYRPFELDRLERLSSLSTLAGAPGDHADLPAVSICSGRSYPYVEAMSQALGLVTPVLFEAGGGMFDPVNAVTRWHPNFTPEVRKEVDELREHVETLVGELAVEFDYAKRSQVALVGTDPGALARALSLVERHVEEHCPHLKAYHTEVSIDVVPHVLDKLRGIEWLAERVGLSLDEIAYIGDSNGDINALRAVGRSFAPANAADSVKDVVDFVCSGNSIDGVLEAYARCVEANRNEHTA
ncbi:MAG: HAD hydrolase family protein [Rhodothermales bacterium]|nr:HAD hydrolase family protein [Rhodothermales bacterium]